MLQYHNHIIIILNWALYCITLIFLLTCFFPGVTNHLVSSLLQLLMYLSVFYSLFPANNENPLNTVKYISLPFTLGAPSFLLLLARPADLHFPFSITLRSLLFLNVFLLLGLFPCINRAHLPGTPQERSIGRFFFTDLSCLKVFLLPLYLVDTLTDI